MSFAFDIVLSMLRLADNHPQLRVDTRDTRQWSFLPAMGVVSAREKTAAWRPVRCSFSIEGGKRT